MAVKPRTEILFNLHRKIQAWSLHLVFKPEAAFARSWILALISPTRLVQFEC